MQRCTDRQTSSLKLLVHMVHTDLLTPHSTVLLDKLTGLQLVKKFPAFMEPEGSLPHLEVPATCPYSEPARSSPYPHILLPEDQSLYIPPIYAHTRRLHFRKDTFEGTQHTEKCQQQMSCLCTSP